MPAVNVNIQPEIISWALSQTQEEKLGDKLMNNINEICFETVERM